MPETRYACPVCGTVHEHQSDRYKNHACHQCAARARCADDRPVSGYNTSPMGGGFMAMHTDRTGSRCKLASADGRVWIDGTEFKMGEAYMGGIVTVPLDKIVPVEQTVMWSRDGHIEWTSAGVPEGYVGFVGDKAGRNLLGRPTTTYEWMVRTSEEDHSLRRTVAQGVAKTPDKAKSSVYEVLGHLARKDTEQAGRDEQGRDDR